MHDTPKPIAQQAFLTNTAITHQQGASANCTEIMQGLDHGSSGLSSAFVNSGGQQREKIMNMHNVGTLRTHQIVHPIESHAIVGSIEKSLRLGSQACNLIVFNLLQENRMAVAPQKLDLFRHYVILASTLLVSVMYDKYFQKVLDMASSCGKRTERTWLE